MIVRALLGSCCMAAGLLVHGARAQSTTPPFTVVLDAAHGGPDIGVRIGPQLLEKNLTLNFSIQLRSALAARGMRVVTTRETDADPTADDRAGIADHAQAQACIVLHATASGSGVHLYTTSLNAMSAGTGLAPWATAQSPWVTRSLKLSSDLSAALAGAGIPFTLGRVRLAPLESMECPAVAVEVAPLRPTGTNTGSASLASAGYQQQLVNAIAAGLVTWRADAGAAR